MKATLSWRWQLGFVALVVLPGAFLLAWVMDDSFWSALPMAFAGYLGILLADLAARSASRKARKAPRSEEPDPG